MRFDGLFCSALTLVAAAGAVPVDEERWSRPCAPWSRVERKEWGHMDRQERKSYIQSVQCLQTRPSILDPKLYPAVKSRFDDFTATHINYSSFYAWHRGFLELFENALRGECGYKGGQPYFDWPQHAATLDKNELFDGSEYSIGSNGAYVPGRPSVVLGPYLLPPGSGGGCVKSGPFSNYTVPFRSFNLTEAFQGGPPATGYVEAPHCLTRDLNNVIASRYLNSSSERAALAATSLTAFDLVVQGNFSTSEIGMHGGGHFAGGGQMFDFFASPEDPFFFFHHGYVDRLWDRWQHAGPGRFLQIFGTQTFNNIPPSAPATIDDLVEWGCLGPAKRIRDVVQLGRNGYCSQYD